MLKEYFKGFRHFASKRRNKALIVFIAIFTTIGCLLFFLFTNIYTKTLEEQMLHRQQLATRSAARSTETFFALMGAQVSNYASRDDLDGFLENLNDFPIGGVMLLDKNGQVIKNASRDGVKVEGVDLSDRYFFISLKDNPDQKFVIGKPVVSMAGYSKGKYIVNVASPVLENGEFNGVLTSSVILDHLNNDFFNPVKLTENTSLYLVDENLDIVSSLTGECDLKDNSSLIKDTINLRKENKFITDCGQKMLTAVAPVEYALDRTWALVIATPEKEAYMFATPFESYSLVILIYVIVVITGFSCIVVLVAKIAKRDGYLEGFENGKRTAGHKK